MSYGIFEDLHSGANSENLRVTSSRRNFAALVFQAKKDFGPYLASAGTEQELGDRVDQVLAELRYAGVKDAESVLEALAASDEPDDTEEDSDDSESDSDVPDFVDTDKDDDKERKESAKLSSGYAPDMDYTKEDSQHLQDTGFQDPNSPMVGGTTPKSQITPVAAPAPAAPGSLGLPALGLGAAGTGWGQQQTPRPGIRPTIPQGQRSSSVLPVKPRFKQ